MGLLVELLAGDLSAGDLSARDVAERPGHVLQPRPLGLRLRHLSDGKSVHFLPSLPQSSTV